jgi:hypothetical protein
VKKLALALLIPLGAFAQVEPYTFYGGQIETETKNQAIEDCEYRELVENQRCNERVNKSECIKDVHAQCRQEFGGSDAAPGADPDTLSNENPR